MEDENISGEYPKEDALQGIQPQKRKKYLLFIYSLNRLELDVLRSYERIFAAELKGFTVIKSEDPDEALKALLVKNVTFVFIHSSIFNDDIVSIDFAAECKKRKKCPIIFSAIKPQVLIKEYSEKLWMYSEVDDYFTEPIDIEEMRKKFQIISNVNVRSAKRFTADLPVDIYLFEKGENIKAQLQNISLVGFSFHLTMAQQCKLNEQIQVKIPLTEIGMFHELYGDFFKLSAKVRRLSLTGEDVGCSIEHLTPMQTEVLIQILQHLLASESMKRVFEYVPTHQAKPAIEY